jgi:hypothetical protein
MHQEKSTQVGHTLFHSHRATFDTASNDTLTKHCNKSLKGTKVVPIVKSVLVRATDRNPGLELSEEEQGPPICLLTIVTIF